MIVGSSNAVNLTDGLDGLAIMPVSMIAIALEFLLMSLGILTLLSIWICHSLRMRAKFLFFVVLSQVLDWVFLVQHVSSSDLYGRCWRCISWWNSWNDCCDRQTRADIGYHGGVFIMETLSVYFRLAHSN